MRLFMDRLPRMPLTRSRTALARMGPIDVLEFDGMTRWALVLPTAGDEPR